MKMKKLIILTIIMFPYTSFAGSFPESFQTPTPVPGLQGYNMTASYITPDGQRMLLTMWSPVRIHDTTWDPIEQTWTTPRDMGFDNWDGHASLNPEGNTMYYANHGTVYADQNGDPSDDLAIVLSGTQPPISIGGGRAYFGLSWLDYTDIGWASYDPSDPVNGFGPVTALSEINTNEYAESYPHVTPDHQTLLFHSHNLPGGYGSTDIWRATWNGSQWVDVINLGPTINTTAHEGHPFYCPSTRTLYFQRGVSLMQAVATWDPIDLLVNLMGKVIALNLPQGIKSGLVAKLNAALLVLVDTNQNNDVAAINILQGFINAVEAQRSNQILEDDADELIAAALEIIALLSPQ
jgi:hypothetical protein